jgi:hypothetical protein
MGRNHLAHAQGDAINAVLAAAGYNFRRLLAWLAGFFVRRNMGRNGAPYRRSRSASGCVIGVLHRRLKQGFSNRSVALQA